MTTTIRAPLLLPTLGPLMLGLLGCAGEQLPWYREGMTAAELQQDQKECATQSQNYGFVTPQLNSPGSTQPGGGSAGRVVVQDEGDLFRTCMNARGYARVPPPPKPNGAK
jgi:hypothetical protein